MEAQSERQFEMDAYRYFFPAGWVMGVWGVLLWILFPWNLIEYPGQRHPTIMMGGFFLFFVSGFLMTAAPKFTATFGPTLREQRTSFLLIGALFLSLLAPGRAGVYFVQSLIFLFLIYFLFRRFRVRKSDPPDSFVFVGFGVFTGFIGVLILFLGEFFDVPQDVYSLGRLLFLQAYVLCLVLGVGSRLIPALLGWAPLPTDKKTSQPSWKVFAFLGVLFLSTYILESLSITFYAHLFRALITSFIGFKFWRLQRIPKRRGVQSWWLWISAWSLLGAQWAVAFLPVYRIHILHVELVSGLALMTLMIATRVILSHGHHGLEMERNSKALFFGALLISLAGFTRLSAGFLPQVYQSHLVYAAYTWILAIVLWGLWFLPRTFLVKSP